MNNMYKFNIGIMTIAGLCAAFVSCKNEDLSDVSEAQFPEKVEFVFPEEIKGLIYTDELGNSNLPLLSGETVKLGYEIYPENVTFNDVLWTSSNEAVATVSEDGVVRAIYHQVQLKCMPEKNYSLQQQYYLKTQHIKL